MNIKWKYLEFRPSSQDLLEKLFQFIVIRLFFCFVFNSAKKPPHLWTGGVGSNRKFIWFSTGTPVATRTWGIGNPDNSGNVENCVQIFENTNKLNDIKCFEKMGFVCEKTPGNDEEKPSADFGKYRGLVFNFNQGK